MFKVDSVIISTKRGTPVVGKFIDSCVDKIHRQRHISLSFLTNVYHLYIIIIWVCIHMYVCVCICVCVSKI